MRLVTIFWFISATVCVAQQIPGKADSQPSLEVATIRPWKPSTPSPSRVLPMRVEKEAPVEDPGLTSDRVDFIGQIELLISSAFGLPADSGRILNAPDWVLSEADRYEVQAKIDDARYAVLQKLTSPEQHEVVAAMEQTLLANRFKLLYHREKRVLKANALVVGKSGPRLTPAHGTDSSRLSAVNSHSGSEITARAISISDLVRSPLLRTGQFQLLDQTGLSGRYNFTLRWRPADLEDASASDDASTHWPLLPTALQEQLGLRLVPTKAPLEVIVIDHIERPSAN